MRWRRLAGTAVLVAVVWWVGLDPLVRGVRALDARTLVLGALLGVPVTVAAAWRWRLVARGLGVDLPLARATAACYRSQLLNCVLPGGVLGDVHRGLDHGRTAGDVPRGLRAVVWERTAGQLVQGAVALVVLVLLPSPVRSTAPVVVTVVALVVALLLVLARSRPVVGADLAALLRRRTWPAVVVSSVVTVAGLLAMYLVAARAVGVAASALTVVPLAMLVLVAAAVPANLAGWGPREGMAAWAFAAAGLGADAGVATSVAFGVMVLVSVLPGAAVLLLGVRRPRIGRRSVGRVEEGVPSDA